MSAQMPVTVSTTPLASQTTSQEDFQTAAGYRELAAQTAANAATHRAQAKRFAEQGQSELSHACHQLAEEAAGRSGGYAAIADFLEKRRSPDGGSGETKHVSLPLLVRPDLGSHATAVPGMCLNVSPRRS
jgi:hypothetical protein